MNISPLCLVTHCDKGYEVLVHGIIPSNNMNFYVHSREKPWRNGVTQEEGMWQFYDAQDAWYPTWTDEGDNFAMKVREREREREIKTEIWEDVD